MNSWAMPKRLDEQGRLMLRLADGSVQAISAGDVFPLAPRTAPLAAARGQAG